MRNQFMILAILVVVLLFFRAALAQEPGAALSEPALSPQEKARPEMKGKGVGKDKKAAQEQKSNPRAESGGSTLAAEAEKPQPKLDRRWIIKMKDEKDKKMPARKPVALAWAGKDQQTRCEAYLPALQESFSKTRYYSVGGDGCNTAGSAKAFLDLAMACEGDCPQGFLESKGYSKQILRNVDILHQLGEKKCMESTKEIGTVKVKTDKAIADPERKSPIAVPHKKERRKVGSWSQDKRGETR